MNSSDKRRGLVDYQCLKIISFGPRPLNFPGLQRPDQTALQSGCGRLKENSELDLFEAFNKHR